MLINGVARAGGLEVLSRPNVEYADLDGHLDLLDDPTTAAVHLVDGVLHPSPEAGFGILDLD